ncbi:MAG TPA: hypothetical protein PKI76_05085, partial [Oscillospiraceae bacterium]|nr:hypothetical protein [Oscillospiraceae bacterium]
MRKKLLFSLFCATAALFLGLYLTNLALRPFLEKTSVFYAKVRAEEALNRTAAEVFAENGAIAEGIVRIQTNNSGET